MDLKHILNPMPEPDEPPPAVANSQSGTHSEGSPPIVSTGYLQSRLFLSPRRLDPETASVSTNSSTKRRRTNRGRVDIDRVRQGQSAAAMGRSFSEIDVPSDSSTNDDENAVKCGVAQLSLSDDPAKLRLGTRVEALKSGTQGTWYVARIVEFASFPGRYLDRDGSDDSPNEWYPMLMTGFSPLQSAWIPQTSLRLMSDEADMSPSEWANYKKLWRHGPRGLEDDWKEYAEFVASQYGRLPSNTGVVWAGENHGCPCRFHKKSSAETKRESVGVGRHPERPDRLQKIIESWQKNTLLRHVHRLPSREITKPELALAHTGEHIRNYFAQPSWYRIASRAATRLPSPPPSSTGSTSATTIAESARATPQPLAPIYTDTEQRPPSDEVTLSESPVKAEFEQEFPPLQSPSGTTFKERFSGSLYKRRASGLDMDLMAALAAVKDEIEVKPAVWPETLTHMMACGELAIAVDTTFDPERSPKESKMATGSLLNLCDAVITGRVKNGFALIRPPGHHAEPDAAMGFCIYNNVGVAAKWALQKFPRLVKRILIIDWDVHHGNGTERIFYEDPNVLFISLHRHDDGTFYPFTGSPYRVGSGAGVGKNVNITWDKHRDRPNDRIGDPEYLAAFHYLIMPIATEFNPDLVKPPFQRRNNVQVLVSAGFDAAEGHSNGLGGLRVTPGGYAMMTKLVTQLAQGRVILALEGGYELAPLANSATACLEQLISSSRPSPPPIEGMLRTLKPCMTAQENLAKIWGVQRDYWRCLREGPSPFDKGWALPREWKRERGNSAENNFGTPIMERRKRRLTSEGY